MASLAYHGGQVIYGPPIRYQFIDPCAITGGFRFEHGVLVDDCLDAPDRILQGGADSINSSYSPVRLGGPMFIGRDFSGWLS